MIVYKISIKSFNFLNIINYFNLIMSYVFIWDTTINNLFFKSIGGAIIGEGFTLSNFVMISDNNEYVLLDLPFGNAIKGNIYFFNNKGLTLLEKIYDLTKYNKKIINCYYNGCACNKKVYKKIECFIYCINNPEIIKMYMKKLNKETYIIE
jgi:hypothetical protein